MTDKKEWLLLFVRKFREILDSDGYREYREFFPAFCNTPYLSIELLEVHDKEGEHDGNIISFYSSEYGDQVKIVEQEKSFWGSFFKGVTYGLEYLTDYISKSGDLTNIQAFRKYYEFNQNYSTNFSLKEFRNSIDLPLNFLEQDVTNFIKKLIDKEILSKLKILTNNHLYEKAIFRISLLKVDEINEIIEFLDSEWSEIEESTKCEKFTKIFYVLGFEVIPIENLLSHRNFKDLNNLSHPELIAYDPNSNYILLFEELAKFDKKYLYKKDAVQKIIVRFNNLFYIENRKIDYLIITSEEISIDLNHYDYKYRVILKKTFTDLLKQVFNKELNQINIPENFQIRYNVIRLINSIKTLNYNNNNKREYNIIKD
jgi:hypothetical protein